MSRSATILARILASKAPRIGPFLLRSSLGAGGFAPVFLAAEVYANVELRTVALKLFAVDADDELEAGGSTGTGTLHETRDRVVEEARALCRVEHPNVVRFLQLATDDSGTVFGLAMEHVEGRPLKARIEATRGMSVTDTLDAAAAIASALAAVHRVGLVHRDVKPSNVVEANGVYKLIDFGIAARAPKRRAPPSPGGEIDVALEEDDGATMAHRAGTVGYMDPACYSGVHSADSTSDLYGLGATMFECLSGRLPASAGSGKAATRLRTDVLAGAAPATPIASLVEHVPPEVAKLIDSLLSATPSRRPHSAEWVACEIEQLRRAVRGRTRALPPEGPFRGLARFDERHRDVYFGRSAEVAAGVEILRSRGLLAIVGPSGSGKSSLACAGIAPEVADRALSSWPARWSVVTMSPGNDPTRALSNALGRSLPKDPRALVGGLAADAEADNRGTVIVVDQLEELVTIAPAGSAAYVTAFLAHIAQTPLPGLRAIVTLRRDWLDSLLALPDLGRALVRGTQLVTPLTAGSWTEVVVDALAAYGFALDDEARALLARELENVTGSMPLVQFALTRLWAERNELDRTIRAASLLRIGGIAGALERHAEETLSTLVAARGPATVACARLLLVALTTPKGTRTRRRADELTQGNGGVLARAVLESLERARLVVVEEGEVMLAHEALVTQWRRLREWIEELRTDRELAQEIEEAAAGWSEKREHERLFRGRRLAAAQELRARKMVPLSPTAERFVTSSRRFGMRGIAGLIALVVSLVVGLGITYAAYTRARHELADEKRAAVGMVQVLSNAKGTSESERARAFAQVLQQKTSCEHERDALLGKDAGAPATMDGGALKR